MLCGRVSRFPNEAWEVPSRFLAGQQNDLVDLVQSRGVCSSALDGAHAVRVWISCSRNSPGGSLGEHTDEQTEGAKPSICSLVIRTSFPIPSRSGRDE
jgi:hypothetical protein